MLEPQTKSKFMSSCMMQKDVNDQFPVQAQRFNFCSSLWEHKKTKASFVVATNAEEFIADDSLQINTQDEWDEPGTFKKVEKQSKDEAGVSDKEKEQNSAPSPQDPPPDDLKAVDYNKNGESAYIPSLNGPGLAQNPDNSTAPLDDAGKPDIKKMQWYFGCIEAMNDYGQIEYLEPNNVDIKNKIKEWFVSKVDQQMKAEYPQTFQEIEKKFARPNKGEMPKAMKDMDEDREKQNAVQVQKDYNPFGL